MTTHLVVRDRGDLEVRPPISDRDRELALGDQAARRGARRRRRELHRPEGPRRHQLVQRRAPGTGMR